MISIILPAYNCGHEIGALLDCVARSELTPREVIVVDDCSTDDTRAICEARPEVRLIRQDRNRGPAAARNLGAAHAGGEILFFIDSDVLLPEDRDVLKEMGEAFDRRPDIDMLSTVSHPQPRVPSAIAYNNSIYHYYYMQRFFADRARDMGPPDHARERVGRIMFFSTRLGAVRTQSFKRSGGFMESLTGVMNEDGEYGVRCYHLGFVNYLNSRLVNLHRYPTDSRRYTRSYYHAAFVQAQIDEQFDTTADETTSGSERIRRLLACCAFLVPLPFIVCSPQTGFAVLAAWALAMGIMLRPLGRLIREHVPPRYWIGWLVVYIAITPLILIGYGAGKLQYRRGRVKLVYPPSTHPYFDAEARTVQEEQA